jgi:hypothetical protein
MEWNTGFFIGNFRWKDYRKRRFGTAHYLASHRGLCIELSWSIRSRNIDTP